MPKPPLRHEGKPAQIGPLYRDAAILQDGEDRGGVVGNASADARDHVTNHLDTRQNSSENLAAIADQFKPQGPEGKVIDIREYGNGNVNETFLVTLDSRGEKHFILQRINRQVFQQPELVMLNMRTVTEHVRKRLERAPLGAGRDIKLSNTSPKDADAL